MREEILRLIENKSRIDLKEAAILLGMEEAEVANAIAEMEKENIICGYYTLIDWDKTNEDRVTALIEVRVTPQRGTGFDEIAERILTLGGVPLHSYAAYTKVATLKAKENVTDGDACLRAVVEDVQVLLKQEREILSVAAEIGDDGTQDVFSSYVSSQEKLLWMLDAYLNQK